MNLTLRLVATLIPEASPPQGPIGFLISCTCPFRRFTFFLCCSCIFYKRERLVTKYKNKVICYIQAVCHNTLYFFLGFLVWFLRFRVSPLFFSICSKFDRKYIMRVRRQRLWSRSSMPVKMGVCSPRKWYSVFHQWVREKMGLPLRSCRSRNVFRIQDYQNHRKSKCVATAIKDLTGTHKP